MAGEHLLLRRKKLYYFNNKSCPSRTTNQASGDSLGKGTSGTGVSHNHMALHEVTRSNIQSHGGLGHA